MSKQVDSDNDTEEDEEDTEEDGEVAEEGWNSCMFHLLDRSWKLKENLTVSLFSWMSLSRTQPLL